MSDGPPGRISALIHVSRGLPGPTGEPMRVQVCIPVTATPQWLVDHPQPDPGDAAAHRLWLTAVVEHLRDLAMAKLGAEQ